MYTYVQKFYLYFATCFRFLLFKIHINVVKAQAPTTVRLVTNLLSAGAILCIVRDRLIIYRLLRRIQHFYVHSKHESVQVVGRSFDESATSIS